VRSRSRAHAERRKDSPTIERAGLEWTDGTIRWLEGYMGSTRVNLVAMESRARAGEAPSVELQSSFSRD
jgi:hypothetical protein